MSGFRTFGGDWEHLAHLIDATWGAHYEGATRFRYPPDWLAAFFGPGGDAELLVEYRDAAGAMTGFFGAVPRTMLLGGRPRPIALATLLTSARGNVGIVGLDLERELFERARARGLFGTYHFTLSNMRVHQMLELAASIRRTPAVELASAQSMIGQARPRPASDFPDVRAAEPGDLSALVDLVERASHGLQVGRRVGAADFGLADGNPLGKRALVALRDGSPVAACSWTRRTLVGRDGAEVANVDLLVGPEATAEEAGQLVAALSDAAAALGATYLVAPRRADSVFPHARSAGLRLAMRTLRVFVVPSVAGDTVPAGADHLFEVE